MVHLEILQNSSLVLIHENPQYAESAALIMAREWNHHQSKIDRNINYMKVVPVGHFPCHMALLLKNALSYTKNQIHDTKNTLDEELVKTNLSENDKDFLTVIGHAKLTRADGRSDGSCCIAYSVIIDLPFRGLGLGRLLMDKIEVFIKELGISYIYLSTPDKVSFYEHLGYKKSEFASTLGENSKRLDKTQIASLEGLFAKRLDITPAAPSNVWLRKRLIFDYPIRNPLELQYLADILCKQLGSYTFDGEFNLFSCVVINLPWQQQVGPSCGVAALKMISNFLKNNSCSESHSLQSPDVSVVRCIGCSSDVVVPNTSTKNMSAIEFCIENGISNDGELFCSYNVLLLAASYFHLKVNVHEITQQSYLKIIQNISNDSPVLIPYDRSLANHKPEKFNGKHSHWAIINGFIFKESNLVLDCERLVRSEINSTQLNVLKNNFSHNDITLMSDIPCEFLYLVCTHGMSNLPFICPYSVMISSNQQLTQCKSNYYLSADDLVHLRNKIIFLQ